MHLRKCSGSTQFHSFQVQFVLCALGNCAIVYDEFLIAISPTRNVLVFGEKIRSLNYHLSSRHNRAADYGIKRVLANGKTESAALALGGCTIK
jgi:hypothetical protein